MAHIMRIDEMQNHPLGFGLSGWKIENSNTNFGDFDVPLVDTGIVTYIKSRYTNDVYATNDNTKLFGGNWRVYSFMNRNDRIDLFVNDDYFALLPSEKMLHPRSEVKDVARDIVEKIIKEHEASTEQQEREMLYY